MRVTRPCLDFPTKGGRRDKALEVAMATFNVTVDSAHTGFTIRRRAILATIPKKDGKSWEIPVRHDLEGVLRA
jgi:hypothetical protein